MKFTYIEFIVKDEQLGYCLRRDILIGRVLDKILSLSYEELLYVLNNRPSRIPVIKILSVFESKLTYPVYTIESGLTYEQVHATPKWNGSVTTYIE